MELLVELGGVLRRDPVPELLGVEPARGRGRDRRNLTPRRYECFGANVARHDVGEDEAENRDGDRREDADTREQAESRRQARDETLDTGPSAGGRHGRHCRVPPIRRTAFRLGPYRRSASTP